MQLSPFHLLLFLATATASPHPTSTSTSIPSVSASIPPDIITAAFISAAESQVICVSNNVRNDLNNGLCNDIVVIYARGTFGSGNIGCDIGVAFVDAVATAKPGKVIVQGVPYNANIVCNHR